MYGLGELKGRRGEDCRAGDWTYCCAEIIGLRVQGLGVQGFRV